jgi:hypothetical protein
MMYFTMCAPVYYDTQEYLAWQLKQEYKRRLQEQAKKIIAEIKEYEKRTGKAWREP